MTSEQDQEVAVNGIEPDKRLLLLGQLADTRRVKEFSGPWTARTNWAGGFKTEAQVRGHTIRFDEPGDLAAEDTAPTPHEYVLSALGACLTAGVVMHATVRGIRLHTVRIDLSGTFDNILRWAGLSDTGNPGYRAMEIKAYLGGDASENELRDLWDRALTGSPVAQTIGRPTPIVAIMEIVPEPRP